MQAYEYIIRRILAQRSSSVKHYQPNCGIPIYSATRSLPRVIKKNMFLPIDCSRVIRFSLTASNVYIAFEIPNIEIMHRNPFKSTQIRSALHWSFAARRCLQTHNVEIMRYFWPVSYVLNLHNFSSAVSGNHARSVSSLRAPGYVHR